MAIDTHSHLFDEAFTSDLPEVLERIKSNNISKVVIVGFNEETNNKAFDLCKDKPNFYPTAGIHPDQAESYTSNDLVNLIEFIHKNKVYAIGECGLDYYWTKDYIDKQKLIFEEQIKLSIEENLPLIIHSRDAILDTYNLLEKYRGKVRFVMHCYSGSLEMAYRFLDLGGYISLGGTVTFKNANKVKEVAKMIPLDRLMVETDCPYLTPVPFRGKRNESSFVRYVIDEIASLRNMDSKELENILDQNSIKFFNL